MAVNDPSLVHLVMFLLPAMIFVMALMVAFYANGQVARKSAANLTVLAGHLGLEVVTPPPSRWGLFSATATVHGVFQGKAVRFYTFTTGTGKSQQTWCTASVQITNPGKLHLDLHPENLFTKLGHALGLHDVETGDAAFDKAYVVKSSDKAYAAAALLPEIRQQLLAARTHGAIGKIATDASGTEVRYVEIGTFAHAVRTERLASMLPVVCAIADVIEVYRPG